MPAESHTNHVHAETASKLPTADEVSARIRSLLHEHERHPYATIAGAGAVFMLAAHALATQSKPGEVNLTGWSELVPIISPDMVKAALLILVNDICADPGGLPEIPKRILDWVAGMLGTSAP